MGRPDSVAGKFGDESLFPRLDPHNDHTFDAGGWLLSIDVGPLLHRMAASFRDHSGRGSFRSALDRELLVRASYTLAAVMPCVVVRLDSLPMFRLCLINCLLWMCATLPAEEVRHSFFIAGLTFTGIIAEDGSEQWDSGRPAARDGFVLPGGNILIAWSDEVKEFTPAHDVVFAYQLSSLNKEIGTAVRLATGRTLITELGEKPRLLEVNADGSIAVECPLLPETDNAHMQTRMARKLANGNYLVPHLLAFQVKEYKPSGEVVRSLPTDLPELGGRAAENWPFTAIELSDGRVLVNLTHGNKTVEFDKAGRVVWQVSNADFPDQKPFADPCGGQRLPNGNTVIASYASQGPIKVFEVTPEKKIVWTYSGPHRAHEIQVLTTNGQPITEVLK